MKKKQNSGLVTKVALPLFVVAVVVGSFSVDWTRFGRAPVSYYGMGAIPMFATCQIDGANLKKPKQKPEMANSALPAKKIKKVAKEVAAVKAKKDTKKAQYAKALK